MILFKREVNRALRICKNILVHGSACVTRKMVSDNNEETDSPFSGIKSQMSDV